MVGSIHCRLGAPRKGFLPSRDPSPTPKNPFTAGDGKGQCPLETGPRSVHIVLRCLAGAGRWRVGAVQSDLLAAGGTTVP